MAFTNQFAYLGFAAAVSLAGPLPAQAQDYPSRAVKIIVPFAAGGPADNYARFMGQQLQAGLGQNFIIENNEVFFKLTQLLFVSSHRLHLCSIEWLSN